jgi:hypothetical protein
MGHLAIRARCKHARLGSVRARYQLDARWHLSKLKGVSIFPLRLARHTLPTVRGSRIFSAGRNDKVIEKVLFAAVRKSLPGTFAT